MNASVLFSLVVVFALINAGVRSLMPRVDWQRVFALGCDPEAPVSGFWAWLAEPVEDPLYYLKKVFGWLLWPLLAVYRWYTAEQRRILQNRIAAQRLHEQHAQRKQFEQTTFLRRIAELSCDAAVEEVPIEAVADQSRSLLALAVSESTAAKVAMQRLVMHLQAPEPEAVVDTAAAEAEPTAPIQSVKISSANQRLIKAQQLRNTKRRFEQAAPPSPSRLKTVLFQVAEVVNPPEQMVWHDDSETVFLEASISTLGGAPLRYLMPEGYEIWAGCSHGNVYVSVHKPGEKLERLKNFKIWKYPVSKLELKSLRHPVERYTVNLRVVHGHLGVKIVETVEAVTEEPEIQDTFIEKPGLWKQRMPSQLEAEGPQRNGNGRYTQRLAYN